MIVKHTINSLGKSNPLLTSIIFRPNKNKIQYDVQRALLNVMETVACQILVNSRLVANKEEKQMAYFNPHRKKMPKSKMPKKTARAKRAAKKVVAPKREKMRDAPPDVAQLEDRLADKEL